MLRATVLALIVLMPVLTAGEVSLKAGDPAPALTVEKWVKGDPVARFERGKVYVVEFWATWCGPCIASMPHLSKIQKRHAADGLRIVAVTASDPNNDLDAVEKMVAEKGDTMGYTVAWDADRSTWEAWMTAAGVRGIPASFVVDREGKIAYIGHPMWLDLPVKRCLEGTWDLEKGPAELEALQKELQSVFQLAQNDPEKGLGALDAFAAKAPEVAEIFRSLRFQLLLHAGEHEKASKLGGELYEEALAAKDASALNEVAWTIVDPDRLWKQRDLKLARKAAEKAVELTEAKDAAILDTLARVHFWEGDLDKAVELQKKAVDACVNGGDATMWSQLQTVLDEYEEARRRKGGN